MPAPVMTGAGWWVAEAGGGVAAHDVCGPSVGPAGLIVTLHESHIAWASCERMVVL